MRILEGIQEFDIDTGLENLEHSECKEIGELARSLREKKRVMEEGPQGGMTVEGGDM